MNVTLTPELEQLVQNKVQTGRYQSANDVMGEALRLLEKRDLVRAEIREKIEAGFASARAGRLSDGETFLLKWKRNLRKKYALRNSRWNKDLKNADETLPSYG